MEKNGSGKLKDITRPVADIGVFRFFSGLLVFTTVIFSFACTELEKPKTEPFFAQTAPPAIQEFRWSNGKTPKSFDPARASAPPETDIVRALYEGLTDTDPKTLKEIPGVATKWEPSADFKTWTFRLRDDAEWSNGKRVTAHDFVRSWERLAKFGAKTAHSDLLNNIVGFPVKKIEPAAVSSTDLLLNSAANKSLPIIPQTENSNSAANNGSTESLMLETNTNTNTKTSDIGKAVTTAENKPGFTAEDDLTLIVHLKKPDKDFPKLVANPIFRPVYGDGLDLETGKLNAEIVTNGAFKLSEVEIGGVVLDRSANYWNQGEVGLERVKFVPMDTAEKALDAYRAGNLDAVTNASFAPLALKLLSPYDDFRKTTHAALNFYEINAGKVPFTDRRVRQALSNAIERERLTEGEMEGSTQPAFGFLPFGLKTNVKLTQDKEKARDLLEEAGFPDGKNFPVIRLLVNRNDTQQRVARLVARMWKQNLNLDTEIIVKEQAELETARQSGDFDLIRRGVVFPTSDEGSSFAAIFGSSQKVNDGPVVIFDIENSADGSISVDPGMTMTGVSPEATPDKTASSEKEMLTEETAIYELRAIPLYFPTSYSLVKPYVSGFEMNSLDAPSLADVMIDNDWQPKKSKAE